MLLTSVTSEPFGSLVILKWNNGIESLELSKNGLLSEDLPVKIGEDLQVLAWTAFDAAINNINYKSVLWKQAVPGHLQKKGHLQLQGKEVKVDLKFIPSSPAERTNASSSSRVVQSAAKGVVQSAAKGVPLQKTASQGLEKKSVCIKTGNKKTPAAGPAKRPADSAKVPAHNLKPAQTERKAAAPSTAPNLSSDSRKPFPKLPAEKVRPKTANPVCVSKPAITKAVSGDGAGKKAVDGDAAVKGGSGGDSLLRAREIFAERYGKISSKEPSRFIPPSKDIP